MKAVNPGAAAADLHEEPTFFSPVAEITHTAYRLSQLWELQVLDNQG